MHCLCEREKHCHCERSEATQKMFVQSLDCHDFLRSLAVTEYFATPSLRGVKQRSNPGSERWLMDCHVASLLAIDKISLSLLTCIHWIASLLAMSRTHPRAYQVLLCKTCGNDSWFKNGNDGGWTRFFGDFKGLAP